LRKYRIIKFPTRLIILIIAIIIIAFKPDILTGAKQLAMDILTYPLKAVSGLTAYFTSKGQLMKENLVLKQRIAASSVTLARLREIELENERLNTLLEFKRNVNYDTIIARVIARDMTDWRRSLVIDKGKDHGIKEHMPCATAKGIVGKVTEVGVTSSKVMLITDPNSKIGVVLRSSRESGVLIGTPQGVCRIIYLSLDGEVDKGDMALTAGYSVFFPKGLPIGEVVKTGIDRSNLFKYAEIRPFEDMNKIEELICIDTNNAGKY